jgi:hypothetical protein
MSERRLGTSLRVFAALSALAGAAACAGEPGSPTATVSLGLEGVPERVRSITLMVLRSDRVVASATITPPSTRFELGVPAEVPLELRVVARTERPAGRGLGTMPAFVGSVVRSLPLSSEPIAVGLTVEPAGVLGVDALVDLSLPGATLRLEPDARAGAPVLVPLTPLASSATLVLPRGRYRASVEPTGDRVRARLGSLGPVVVEAEAETTWSPRILPAPEGEDRLASLAVSATLDGRPLVGAHVPFDGAPRTLTLALTASAADGLAFRDDDAAARFVVDVFPSTALADGRARVTRLQARPTFEIRGPGRLLVLAELEPSARRGLPLQRLLAFDVAPPGWTPSLPVEARVALLEPERLDVGTPLVVELIDADGRHALGTPARIAIDRASPWVEVEPRTRAFAGFGAVTVARSAAPGLRAGSVALTVTSTRAALVETATIALPSVSP